MTRPIRPDGPGELHVHIGRLVIDAPVAGPGGMAGFEAALQAALADRLGAAGHGAGVAPERPGVSHAVADAVAARVQARLAPAPGHPMAPRP